MLVQRAKQYAAAHATRLPRLVGRGLMALHRGGRVYGAAYARYRDFLAANRAHFDPEPALLASVRDAIARVPYYRARYAGVRLDSARDFEAAFGFIDRAAISAHEGEMIADGLRREDYDTCATGGTSGTPLTFLAPKTRYVVELATMHALWAEAGFDHHVRAVLRNHRLEGEPYLVDPLRREVIFDGFENTDRHFEAVHRTICELGIAYVHAYPSAAASFAEFLVRRGLGLGPIRMFLCGSETVFPYQRELIEGRLGARLYSWYGHSEKLVLAGYCRGRAAYHVEPTYGYFELVDEAGRVIREPGQVGQTGEIVGTSLHNPGMPLVRYRTGDFATYAGSHCDACGRDVVLLESIRGQRSGERIYRADGTYITTTALNFHDELHRAFLGLQYVQAQAGELDVLIVKAPHFTAAHERELLAHLRGRLGEDLAVRVRHVDRLERAANGKSPHLISRIQHRGDPPA